MSRPAWLEPLPAAEAMRATDRWAIEERGIPSLALMERAGEGLARVVAEQVPAGRIAIVCGKGNNGGDGLVVARLLRQAGRDADVLLVAEPDALRGDAAEQLRRLPGDPPLAFDPGRLDGAEGIVDALLGTGATGAPKPPLAGVIEAISGAAGRVIAADVPSGVDASTGEVAGVAVHAAATATFHARQAGPVDPSRQGLRRRRRGDRHRHTGRRARASRTPASSAPACSATCRGAGRPRPSSAPATS